MSISLPAPLDTTQARPGSSPGQLYRTVWRWHFYAGLFVVPFALLLALTGGIYLFNPQIENWLYADLYRAPPRDGTTDADAQLQAALASYPGSKAVAYTPPAAEERSALIRLRSRDGRQLTVAVDPHQAKVIGAIDDSSRIMQIIRNLHGKLLLGKIGQGIVELAASWAMVLLVTGLYLWWPRSAGRVFGVLVPRLRATGRIFWRDLHAVTGIWVSGLLVFLILTGLPWSLVAGGIIDDLAGHVGKGRPETGVGFGGGGSATVKSAPIDQGWITEHAQHMAGAGHSAATAGMVPLRLSRIAEIARRLDGVQPPYDIRLPVDAQGVFSVVTDPDDPARTAFVHIDQYSGRTVSDIRWDAFGSLAKGISLGVALHEGRYFGLPNQLIGLAACLGLIGMAITGIVMWWRRRPPGALGVPGAFPGSRLGRGVLAITAGLGIVMPLMGASLVVVLTAEWALRRWRWWEKRGSR